MWYVRTAHSKKENGKLGVLGSRNYTRLYGYPFTVQYNTLSLERCEYKK